MQDFFEKNLENLFFWRGWERIGKRPWLIVSGCRILRATDILSQGTMRQGCFSPPAGFFSLIRMKVWPCHTLWPVFACNILSCSSDMPVSARISAVSYPSLSIFSVIVIVLTKIALINAAMKTVRFHQPTRLNCYSFC